MYINSYVFDCVNAYDGDGVNTDVSETMTCAAGALERIFMSLVTACTSMLSTLNEEEKEKEYQKIINIITTSNPGQLILDSILDWIKSHNITIYPESGLDKTENGRTQQLKEYLMNLFPNETETLINDKIQEIKDSGFDFSDDDTFTYRGGKRKTRKDKKRKNNATIHKRKGNKSVKSKNKNNKRTRKIRKIMKVRK
jgi:hypothetical protein